MGFSKHKCGFSVLQIQQFSYIRSLHIFKQLAVSFKTNIPQGPAFILSTPDRMQLRSCQSKHLRIQVRNGQFLDISDFYVRESKMFLFLFPQYTYSKHYSRIGGSPSKWSLFLAFLSHTIVKVRWPIIFSKYISRSQRSIANG